MPAGPARLEETEANQDEEVNLMAHVEAASRGFERDRRDSKHDSHREDRRSRDRRDRHDDGGEDSRDR